MLYTYDPSIHDYSVDKPEFVDIGHNHFVYGNKKEIEEYKALREKGEPLQPITIRKPGEEVKEENHEVHLSKAEDEFLKTPVHDTGSVWYKVLSFFFPIIGIIAAMVYKKETVLSQLQSMQAGCTVRICRTGRDSPDLYHCIDFSCPIVDRKEKVARNQKNGSGAAFFRFTRATSQSPCLHETLATAAIT